MNEKYHIETLNNKKDIESALALSLRTFFSKSVPENAKKIWKNKWLNEPYLDSSNVYVIRSKNQVIAGLRTVCRTIYRDGQEFNILGIAETFVSPAFQNKGIAGTLTEYVFKEQTNGNADFAFIVARRNIDYYYLKHQGYGLGSYSKATVKITNDIETKYKISALSKNDLELIGEMYTYSYEKCFGRVERNTNYWHYLINFTKLQNIKHYVLENDDGIVGYFSLDGNEIVEIGALPESDYQQILADIYLHNAEIFENKSVTLSIPNNHKLFFNDLQFDVTVSNRECYYGGHVVKILNMKRVASNAEKRLKKEYLGLNISSLKFSVDDIDIEWDGNYLYMYYPECHEPSLNETAFLLGSQQVYGDQSHITNIGRLPFSISRLDEF